MDTLKIPDDMNDKAMAEQMNAEAAVSIRDMLVLLGATDQQLRDSDEQMEILEREPWRRDGLKFEVCHTSDDGIQYGFTRGKIDWSGTRFAEDGENKE